MRLRFLKSYLKSSPTCFPECHFSEVMNMDEDFGVGAVMLSHLVLENSVKVDERLYMGREGRAEERERENDQVKRRKVMENNVYDISCTEAYLKSREFIQWKFKDGEDGKDEIIEKSKRSRFHNTHNDNNDTM